MFRILIVAATESEADILKQIPGIVQTESGFRIGTSVLEILVTGVGSAATAWTLTKWFSSGRIPDLAINAGIAGSYREDIKIGDVVVPVSDCFADAGIETGEGFMTLSEAGLQETDRFPFRNGLLEAGNKYVTEASGYLRTARAITVNTATGTSGTISRLVGKYDPDIETMEGAIFFYICSRENIPFIAFRSISNRVEPRNRSNWNINLALKNLSVELGVFIRKI
jgi:futalosine hydrolase